MIYQIKDWQKHYENNRSREVEQCHYVCLPNKQEGLGFARVLSEPDGLEIYGLWCLILAACSRHRLPRAGYMTDGGTSTGRPWTAEDLAIQFRCKPEKVKRALEFLVSPEIGWITADVVRPSADVVRPSADVVPQIDRQIDRLEEEKGKEAASAAVFPEGLATDAFKAAWSEWLTFRRKSKRKAVSLTAATKQLESLAAIGPARAIEAIRHSIKSDYQGIFEPPTQKQNPLTKPIAKFTTGRIDPTK